MHNNCAVHVVNPGCLIIIIPGFYKKINWYYLEEYVMTLLEVFTAGT